MNHPKWLLSIIIIITIGLVMLFALQQDCKLTDPSVISAMRADGRTVEALTLLNDAINCAEQAPSDAHIAQLRLRAQFFADTFDYTAAGEDLDLAVSLIADDNTSLLAQILIDRGKVFLLKYEWDHAQADFTAAIQYEPSNALAYFERGILFYTMTQREQALADFEMALSLNPQSEKASMIQHYIESINRELQALNDK